MDDLDVVSGFAATTIRFCLCEFSKLLFNYFHTHTHKPHLYVNGFVIKLTTRDVDLISVLIDSSLIVN